MNMLTGGELDGPGWLLNLKLLSEDDLRRVGVEGVL
jgi:hypothetical protein